MEGIVVLIAFIGILVPIVMTVCLFACYSNLAKVLEDLEKICRNMETLDNSVRALSSRMGIKAPPKEFSSESVRESAPLGDAPQAVEVQGQASGAQTPEAAPSVAEKATMPELKPLPVQPEPPVVADAGAQETARQEIAEEVEAPQCVHEEEEPAPEEPSEPRVPTQLELRLVALRNWFIYGRPEGRDGADSVEKMLATTWLLRSGILVLLFSTAFLLKLSIERGLLGPEGRVALSYLAGTALLAVGLHRKLRENYWSLGQALAGLGLGMLYFSSFAMVSMYSLAPVYIGFAVMALVTFTAGLLADRLVSLPIAMVSMLGGYATPLMLSTGQKNIPGLTGYLLLLGCGVLWLARRRSWQQLNVLGILFSYGIFLLVFLGQFETADFAAYQTGLVLFLILFSTSIFIYNVSKRIPAGTLEILGLLANSSIFFTLSMLAIHNVWPDNRLMAAPLTIGLSLLYLLHAMFFNTAEKRQEHRNLLLIFCALSGLFLSLTFPAVLSGHWLGAAWALEGLVLLWLSYKLDSRFIRCCAWALYAATLLRLLGYEFMAYNNFHPTGNDGFWADCLARCCQFAIPVVSLALAARLTVRYSACSAPGEGAEPGASEDAAEQPSGGTSVIGGIFLTLAFGLCLAFLLLELNAVLSYSLPMFCKAGWNLLWMGGAIAALLMLRRKVPGWWKWVFCLLGAVVLVQCIVDYLDLHLWNCCVPEFRWSYSFGTIVNTAVLAFGMWYVSRIVPESNFSRRVGQLFSIVWPVLLFLHTTRELGTIIRYKLPGLSGGGISVLWSIFALAFVINGLRKSIGILRYIGLGLFLVVIVKVFFFDIGNLDAIYRVMAFLAFGILLMGAAFVYLKFWHNKEK